jgi:hypothetical chaperone protein
MLDVIEKGLSAQIKTQAMQAMLADFAAQIGQSAMDTLQDAGCQPSQVDRVVFVGGSSLMQVIRSTLATQLPDAQQDTAEVFTAVVDGLAIAS